MQAEENKAISRRFYEAYDRNDRAALSALLAEGCKVHLPGTGAPLGREAFLEVSALFASAFADSQTTFEQLVAEGDTAIVRWVWQITHRGPFHGIAPTGRRISLPGVTINRIQGGRIVEQWASFDQLTLLQQLRAP